ncbi:hypothetical protein [Nocardioides sp. SYSU DS0651]|uniref:hypothetical protein n=1 Tax=Nocardioides sp. SYSU DS0651 TaxID=3415955 RepID=UPI003F4C0A9C
MSDEDRPYGAVPPAGGPPGEPPGQNPGHPPGYPPPGSAGGPPGFPPLPPPGGGDDRGKGLWIALALLGVLALAGVVTALVLLVAADDDGDGDGEDRATDAPTASAVTSEGASAPPTTGSTSAPPLTDPPSTDRGTDPPRTSGAPGGTSTADQVANDPESVVAAFIDSVLSGDCATAEDLVTKDYLADEGDCSEGMVPTELGDEIETEVGTARVNGDKATVPVTITAYGQSEKGEFYLTRVGDRWLVSGTSE